MYSKKYKFKISILADFSKTAKIRKIAFKKPPKNPKNGPPPESAKKPKKAISKKSPERFRS